MEDPWRALYTSTENEKSIGFYPISTDGLKTLETLYI